MKIHHFGVACSDIIKSKKQYEGLGFVVVKNLTTDYDRNLDYIFLTNEDVKIELIAKHKKEIKSDIDIILEQKKIIGNKIYHICYSSSNIDDDIRILEKEGYKLIKPPTKAIVVDNKKVAFLIHVDIGIIELIEE
jgi:methylmalonyl-CoA/ethylmalonyl-CoA epimerase